METYNYENIDFLTKLYNRKYFLEYTELLMEQKTQFSLYEIDLNRFKIVNDVYGHDVGDIVLQEVSHRLKTLEKNTLLFARFGGDEFAAIYQTDNPEKINALGQKINEVLSENIVVSESAFAITASIGVSRYPVDADNTTDLLKLADMAMYQAKKNENKNQYLISKELNEKLEKRKKIENLLKNINIERDLFLEYQPIFDTNNLKIIGMEALVRWKHEKEGIIYPKNFIAIAEEMDIIKNITRWVFIHGLHQIKEWNEKYNRNLKISLNVAESCIHNKIFFENLKYMLENFKINPSWIAIELTERSLLVSPHYMKNLLISINKLGVEVHIHNFGTSPFMISDLKSFKINTIKIDRKYISKMDDSDIMSIVHATILMANGLGISLGAEGVETKEQYQTIKDCHCPKFQGFYMEKPLSKEAFEAKYLRH